MHQSSRVMLAIDPKFLAQSVEETAHLEDVALTPHWELKDRHIAALMMALHADLEDGQPAGHLYGEMLAATLAAYLVKRFSVRPVVGKRAAGGLPKARLNGCSNLSRPTWAMKFASALSTLPGGDQNGRANASGDAGRYRWFADSLLERNGFELPVPR